MCWGPLQTFPGSFHWLYHVDFKAFPFWLYILIFNTRYHSGQVGALVTRSQLLLLYFLTLLMFFSLKFFFIYIHAWTPNPFFRSSQKVVSQWITKMGHESSFLCTHNTDWSDFQILEYINFMLRSCVVKAYLNYQVGSKSCSVWIPHILGTISYIYLTLNSYLLNEKIFFFQ